MYTAASGRGNVKCKVYGYCSLQSNLPHRYGNSHAIHSVTCHPPEVTFPPLYKSLFTEKSVAAQNTAYEYKQIQIQI